METMSDPYKRFIRHFMTAIAERGLSFAAVAEIMRVGETTVRNWVAGRTVMTGDMVLRAIQHIMGGIYKC